MIFFLSLTGEVFRTVSLAISHKFRKHPESVIKHYCPHCGMMFPIKVMIFMSTTEVVMFVMIWSTLISISEVNQPIGSHICLSYLMHVFRIYGYTLLRYTT